MSTAVLNVKIDEALKEKLRHYAEVHKQPLSTACNYGEACDLLRSGYVKHVRLSWNVGSDEFFRIASDWCDAGAKIKKDGENFVISLKGFPVPPQR